MVTVSEEERDCTCYTANFNKECDNSFQRESHIVHIPTFSLANRSHNCLISFAIWGAICVKTLVLVMFIKPATFTKHRSISSDQCLAKVDGLPFLVDFDRCLVKIDWCLVKVTGLINITKNWSFDTNGTPYCTVSNLDHSSKCILTSINGKRTPLIILSITTGKYLISIQYTVC